MARVTTTKPIIKERRIRRKRIETKVHERSLFVSPNLCLKIIFLGNNDREKQTTTSESCGESTCCDSIYNP